MSTETGPSQSFATLNIERISTSLHPSRDVENRMILEIDRVIGRYMSRPDWSSPYRCTFTWSIEDPHVPSYTVTMTILEPTNGP